jgi:hypothetical protein
MKRPPLEGKGFADAVSYLRAEIGKHAGCPQLKKPWEAEQFPAPLPVRRSD